MAGTLVRMADGQHGETPSVQRMSRVRYLDLVGSRIGRVVDMGIMLLSRLTIWTMLICVSYFDSGCVTEYCSV